MHMAFLLFVTLHGVPTSPTRHYELISNNCTTELKTVAALNADNARLKNGIVYYGSCEPVRHR